MVNGPTRLEITETKPVAPINVRQIDAINNEPLTLKNMALNFKLKKHTTRMRPKYSSSGTMSVSLASHCVSFV